VDRVAADEAKVSIGELLTQAEVALAADAPLTDKQRKSLVPLMRTSDETLVLLADAYDRYKALFGVAFDSDSVRKAIAFEKEQRPVVAQTRALAARLEDQLLVKKADASSKALALYQAMKGLSRLPEGSALRPVIKQVAALMKVKRTKAAAKPVEAEASPAPSPPASQEVALK
jgi:hypothetical protein